MIPVNGGDVPRLTQARHAPVMPRRAFERVSKGCLGPLMDCRAGHSSVRLRLMATVPLAGPRIEPALPTVLVVEDDQPNRILLTRLLERAGYRAVTATDGPSGLAAAFEVDPDILLLDVGLPGMDGLEICRRLRADPRTVALPVVLLTGRTSVQDVVAGLDAGADDFLAKPFHEAELLARLRSARRLARVMIEMESAQGVVAALANAVEAKDSMTEHHCQRLAGLAHLLATAAELDPVSIKGVVFGALLHDIGKIGVSDVILKKPGALTEDEWVQMRQHPLIGEQICRPLASSREFAPIVRHHHERWDGEGYPDRLKGDEIPIGARIVGLVDAFDAIVHDRPYRDARSLERAVSDLDADAGRQFDPDLVERFATIVEREDLTDTGNRLRIHSLAALRSNLS